MNPPQQSAIKRRKVVLARLAICHSGSAFRQALRRLRPSRPSASCLLIAAAALTLVSGCAAVGPAFQRPAAPARGNGYTPESLPVKLTYREGAESDEQRLVEGLNIPGQWWTVFHSEPLNALIDRALKANPNVRAAQAALRAAMENVYAQQGAFFPTLQANVSPSRQKNALGTLSSTLNSGASIFNLQTAQVSVSYVADLFGGNRRQVESLQAQAESQRFQLEATYLTLTSNVVAAAVQEAMLRESIATTGKVIGIEREQLELLRRIYALGAISMADVKGQEAILAQTEASLPPLQKQLAQQRNLLTALAGRYPSEEISERFELSGLTLPKDLPVSLPSDLVEQRPDVRAAEALVHAASAEIGVAQANMLPQLTLNAGYGGAAIQLAQLFRPDNIFWNLTGSATQTLFQGGTLRHRKRAAEAAFDQAAAQYRATVVSAFQNVADSLRALQYDADALKASLHAAQAAGESLDIARRQMQLGSTSYLTMLGAEQTYHQAEINVVQARANRYADTAALFQALGGGWWNRPGAATGEAPAAAGR